MREPVRPITISNRLVTGVVVVIPALVAGMRISTLAPGSSGGGWDAGDKPRHDKGYRASRIICPTAVEEAGT